MACEAAGDIARGCADPWSRQQPVLPVTGNRPDRNLGAGVAATIGLAAADEVPHLPEVEERACELFRTVPATAGLPLYLTPLGDFESAQQEGLLWVARVAGTPVGFALVEPLGKDLHLEELDVIPEHGGRGIGRALLQAVIRHAASRGQGLTLCTFRDVPWNAPWYARLGFREVSPERCGPALQGRMAEESVHGLPPELRVAMRYDP